MTEIKQLTFEEASNIAKKKANETVEWAIICNPSLRDDEDRLKNITEQAIMNAFKSINLYR